VTPSNPFLASHEFNDCRQCTKWPLDIPLFLEASFGVIWNEDVRYGLRAVQIRLRLQEGEQGELQILLGREQAAGIGNAILTSRGTSSLPCWELIRDGGDEDFLDGEYRTTEGPLVSVGRYRHGTRLVSSLTANLHDGFVALDPRIGPVSPNQRAMIEVICALEISGTHRRQCIIELCQQEISLTDVTHAQTL
jgi:hypothetical protein